jgi:hypothetical protein
MNINRVIVGLIVAAVATIAGLTGREAVAIQSMNQPSNYYAGADFAQRHPDVSQPSASRIEQLAALKDSSARLASSPVDLSDYALRHPEFSAAAVPVDTSDFYLRHPTWISTSGAIDTSDYALRHPELSGAQP